MHGTDLSGAIGDGWSCWDLRMHGQVVTGAPFSAVAVGNRSMTLADARDFAKVQSNLFRDAQGRFGEVTMPAIGPLATSGTPKSFVMIHDPCRKQDSSLEPDQKVARKLPAHGKADLAPTQRATKRAAED